jgi:DNA-directed RNA polymerase specialized sigma24 family protein
VTMASLSDGQEAVLRLAYFGGYTQSDIARITGLSVEEVKATMLAAMRKLADVARLRAGLPHIRRGDGTATRR